MGHLCGRPPAMLGNSNLIITISGASGTGKSTLAAALAATLGSNPISFGEFVRDKARKQGIASDRSILQELGEASVRADPDKFVDAFLEWASANWKSPLIVEGVRHLVVDQALRERAERRGCNYVRVHLRAPDGLRARRRTGGDVDALRELDRHPVETEALGPLETGADFVIDSDADMTPLTSAILESV